MNTKNIAITQFPVSDTNVFNGNVNVEQLFEHAIDQANKGMVIKAREMAREALIFAKKQNQYVATYIHGFLAVLSMDFGRYDQARIHVYSALNLLNEDHFSYLSDKQYLSALNKKIRKETQCADQLVIQTLAA